jgi:intracellular multiplication protein IcmL
MIKKIVPLQKPSADAKAPARKTASGVLSHVEMAAGTTLARDALSREKYILNLRVTMFIAVALVLSVLGNVYLGVRPTEYRYFITDPGGRVTEIQAINRPIQSTEMVLNWATQSITKAYSMNFANYAQQLADIKPNFNDAGWRGYEEALKTSGYLDKMLTNQYATSAVPKSAPVIVAQGELNGVFAWRLQIPIIVTYKSASVSQTQDITVDVVVVRRPETEHPSGLGIAQIISQ